MAFFCSGGCMECGGKGRSPPRRFGSTGRGAKFTGGPNRLAACHGTRTRAGTPDIDDGADPCPAAVSAALSQSGVALHFPPHSMQGPARAAELAASRAILLLDHLMLNVQRRSVQSVQSVLVFARMKQDSKTETPPPSPPRAVTSAPTEECRRSPTPPRAIQASASAR
jgi:hypothetical protein